MNARRIIAMLLKDLRDAGRDGRILILLALPIGMAIFYNATIQDDDTLPSTEVAIVEPAGGKVAAELRRAAGQSAELELVDVDDAARARTLVADGTVDLAVVSEQPASARALVLVAQDAPPTAQGVVALVPDALARASGRTPAARTEVRAVAPADQQPYDIIEPRPLAILIAIVLLVAFVAMMVVPIQTAEELETGTFGALRLAATGPEILAAKALAGFIYALAGVALTVVITSLEIDAPVAFFAATLALVVSLVGFGLLLGLLMPNSNAINTYGAFLIFPFVVAASAVFFVDSGVLATILDLLPFSQAAKLLGDALSPETLFDSGLMSWVVIAVWALLGYAVLARIASRREL